MPEHSKMDASDHIVHVYDNVHDWYRSADAKAQVLLATATVFLGFLGSTLLAEPTKLKPILSKFGVETYLCLLLMFVGMSGAIFSALMCLRSRLPIRTSLPEGADSVLFFGYIARMTLEEFKIRMPKLATEDQNNALLNQIWKLSKNVLEKHRWINHGLLLLVSGLLSFVFMCISYAYRIGSPADAEFVKWLPLVPLALLLVFLVVYSLLGRPKGEPRDGFTT